MDSLQNPYTPNAGATPEAIVGRDDQTKSFEALLHRLARGRRERSTIITGPRGVGKTVLLGRFREIALGARWEERAAHRSFLRLGDPFHLRGPGAPGPVRWKGSRSPNRLYGLKDQPEGAALLSELGGCTEGVGCGYGKRLEQVDEDGLRRLIRTAWSREDDPARWPAARGAPLA